MHRVPNIAFAHVGNRGLIRLFLPSLKGRIEGVELDEATKAVLYNSGYHGVMTELSQLRYGEAATGFLEQLPMNYELAIIANADVEGLLNRAPSKSKFIKRPIAKDLVQIFGRRLLEKLAADDPERFANAFFLHEISGVKGSHMHIRTHSAARRENLENLLVDFDPLLPPYAWMDGIDNENEVQADPFSERWYVDVALTFSIPNFVVNWSENGRQMVLGLSYPHHNQEEHGVIKHRVDHASHLHQVGGFLAMRPGNTECSEESPAIQAICYCTDKNVWRKRGDKEGVFRTSHCNEVTTPKKNEKLQHRLRTVGAVMQEVSTILDDDVTGGASSARWEVRTGVQYAINAHWHIPDYENFIKKSLVFFDPTVWW
jgi:hypothetical protein